MARHFNYQMAFRRQIALLVGFFTVRSKTRTTAVIKQRVQLFSLASERPSSKRSFTRTSSVIGIGRKETVAISLEEVPRHDHIRKRPVHGPVPMQISTSMASKSGNTGPRVPVGAIEATETSTTTLTANRTCLRRPFGQQPCDGGRHRT